jgi:circadian clock protein KaiC
VEEAPSTGEDAAVDSSEARLRPTGIPRLDEVLDGGIARGSMAIVVGPPGSGKTTLANQMAFAAARNGKRAIVFTALSESSDKLAMHLRSFTFFDESLLGDAVQFISLQQFIPRGLEATSSEIVSMARAAGADIVVIDGFRGLSGIEPEGQAARKFLYDTGSRLGVLGVTLVITTEAEPRDARFFPEATTADVIIGLHYSIAGVRTNRSIEIVKARATRMLSGLHGLRLTPAGLQIYPRLEGLVAAQQYAEIDAASAREASGENATDGEAEDTSALDPDIESAGGLQGRAQFGLPELDALLGGGLTRGSSTVMIGSPGTGKTLLALQWALEGVDRGEPVVYVSMREDRMQLLHKADMFALGARLREASVPGGGFVLHALAPVELDADVVATRLLRSIERTGARRVVIDSIGEIERAVARSGDPGRVEDYLAALQVTLRQRGVSTISVKESPTLLGPEMAGAAEAIAVLAENVIYMQHVAYQAALHRVLSVVKMRFSAHDTSLRAFTIEAPAGIRVLSLAREESGVIEGITSAQSQFANGQQGQPRGEQPGGAQSGTPPAVTLEAERGPRTRSQQEHP